MYYYDVQLHFQHHYFSLQCHMILQKWSMLKTVVQFNIYVETVIHLVFDEEKVWNNSIHLKQIICNNINVFILWPN